MLQVPENILPADAMLYNMVGVLLIFPLQITTLSGTQVNLGKFGTIFFMLL